MTYTEMIKALKKAGFRLESKETTPGARKAWFSFRGKKAPEMIEAAFEALNRPGGKIERGLIGSHLFRGCGFTVETQTQEYDNFSGIFVSHYLSRPRRREWEMGIDC